MMPRNHSNWWSMHSNLRSTSSTSDHHHQQQQHQHQHEAEIVPTNLLISQTHPSNSLLPPIHHYHYGGSSSSSSSSSLLLPLMSSNSADPNAQDFPHSWSQLLLGGLASEQDQERFSRGEFNAATRVISGDSQGEVKQEGSNNNQNNNLLELYGSQFHEEHDQTSSSVVGVSNRATATWTQIISASLSPKSCITTLSSSTNTTTNNNNNNNIIISSNNMLDFSTNKRAFQADIIHQHSDHTTNSECNSTATTGGVPPKKPRVQSSSTPPLKVRKEKLGDRITALHQLVSPFGKTDTASVLLEAIGYIRFLQGQIEALSSPYMGNNNASANNQHSAHGERNCLFPDHPGQLLNDSCLKRRRASNQQDIKDATKDLKSRGLCLIPISISQLVGSDNGADYWAQSLGGGF